MSEPTSVLPLFPEKLRVLFSSGGGGVGAQGSLLGVLEEPHEAGVGPGPAVSEEACAQLLNPLHSPPDS